jgi:hypothetical protein
MLDIIVKLTLTRSRKILEAALSTSAASIPPIYDFSYSATMPGHHRINTWKAVLEIRDLLHKPAVDSIDSGVPKMSRDFWDSLRIADDSGILEID